MRVRPCLYHKGIVRQRRLPCEVVSIGNFTVWKGVFKNDTGRGVDVRLSETV